jgi:anaerobic selenocysteine-containing dehydrogenase
VEFWSETLQSKGYAPMPDFVPPPHPQPERYPLVLTCAKPTLFCQTQHRALPSLRRRAMDPEVMLHPETATGRGIAAGDWVSVETQNGRDAGASAAQRQYRSACGRGRAWLVASRPRNQCAGL